MSENGTLEKLEKLDMRERIAIMAYESVKSGAINLSLFNAECDTIYGWIVGKPVQTTGERIISSAKKELKELTRGRKLASITSLYPAKKEHVRKVLKTLKGKRKYTKKSKYWSKKK